MEMQREAHDMRLDSCNISDAFCLLLSKWQPFHVSV